MSKALHTTIRLKGRRSALWNMKKLQAVACVGATAGVGLAILAMQFLK